ncbi:hypothetical protein BB561_001343 [Smittium simulii]|uniref:Uncharacterized protein n=1 Tax=Smittium simulii TaxID=133385 RepID=A0A2T9YV05_9FUNG|nr:hypothetical protein BB561_001343 [Smittium simulii]
MKFLNLIFFTGYAAAISCSDNSNSWGSCSNGKVKDYSYNIWINKSASGMHTPIPIDVVDFWTKNQVIKDYSYNIWINKSASGVHTPIPIDVVDFWTKNQVSSQSYVNKLVHPDYMIKKCEATDIDWVYGITKQYNKNRVIDAQEWAGAIKDAYDAMNTYKTYQATVNTDFGSLALEATPIATSRKCKMKY